MELWKERFKMRHLHVGQPEQIAHRSVCLRSLNHAAAARSMGPDPRQYSSVAFEKIGCEC